MRIEQRVYRPGKGWSDPLGGELDASPQLVLVFGEHDALSDEWILRRIGEFYPGAHLFGCSTSGEIAGGEAMEGSVVATAVRLEHTAIRAECRDAAGCGGSRGIGTALARALDKKDLRHVFVLSDGLFINGSDLALGLSDALAPGVSVTGGLAGDGTRFKSTSVICGGRLGEGSACALGFYSDRLKVGYGSLGGWDPFGPERLVTRSRGNVLYQLDGQDALALYETYLGRHAAGLPATALLFPLCLRAPDGVHDGVVRTILAVDREKRTMTFAGDVPEGSFVRLMKANVDRLVDGASGAAGLSLKTGAAGPELAVLISCVGRKLVLKQRTDEEVEAVREIVGAQAAMTGFYSYGELAPTLPGGPCELHNQTMTITTFSER